MSITRKPDTCQLRLDFVEFESIAPDGFGEWWDAYVIVIDAYFSELSGKECLV